MQGDGGNGRVALGKDDGGKVDGVALRCRQWEWPFSIRFLLGIVVLLGQRLHVFVVVVLVLLVHGHGGVVVGARIGVVRGGRDGGAGGGVLGRRWWDVPLRWGVGEGGGLSQQLLIRGFLVVSCGPQHLKTHPGPQKNLDLPSSPHLFSP